MSRPEENALNDPAMELVLPEAAVLAELEPVLLAPGRLPKLWTGDLPAAPPACAGTADRGSAQAGEITVKAVFDYFNGKTIVQMDRDGYQEPLADSAGLARGR